MVITNITKLSLSITEIVIRQAYKLSKSFSILLLKAIFAYVIVNYFTKSILGNNPKY
jgi:hypothetical protein